MGGPYLLDIEEDSKTEIINGVVVMMSPPAFSNHNHVKTNVVFAFKQYLKGNICIPFGDGEMLVLDYPQKGDYVVPDFFVLCDRSKQKKGGVYGVPNLVVEVLSPGSAKYDRGDKKDIYQEIGVSEYWIIDPDKRSIEVYLLRDGVYRLDEIYRMPDDDEHDKEKINAITSFYVKTFPDMYVNLEDIFEYVNSWNE